MDVSNNRLSVWEKLAKVKKEKAELEEEIQYLRTTIKDLTSEKDRFNEMWEDRWQEDFDKELRKRIDRRDGWYY